MVWFGSMREGERHVEEATGFPAPILGSGVEYVFDALATSRWLRRRWERRKLRRALANAVRVRRNKKKETNNTVAAETRNRSTQERQTVSVFTNNNGGERTGSTVHNTPEISQREV